MCAVTRPGIIGTKVAKMDGAHCESIVVNLIQAGAPKAGVMHGFHARLSQTNACMQIFIGILLLIIWSENLPAPTPRYSFFDLFAGKAQASSTWCITQCMHTCVSLSLRMLASVCVCVLLLLLGAEEEGGLFCGDI